MEHATCTEPYTLGVMGDDYTLFKDATTVNMEEVCAYGDHLQWMALQEVVQAINFGRTPNQRVRVSKLTELIETQMHKLWQSFNTHPDGRLAQARQ